MPDPANAPACDTCDEMFVNANPAPALSEGRRRFLEAYRKSAVISQAARLAGVHRATVHRWRADPAFVAAMRATADAFFAEHRAKVIAQEQAREQWRRERELSPERVLMRRENLARARAARRG